MSIPEVRKAVNEISPAISLGRISEKRKNQ